MIDNLQDIGLKSSGVIEFEYSLPVKKIKKEAFYENTQLTSISISAAQAIEDKTFEGCTSLKYLNLPPLANIGSGIFGSTRPPLESLILHEGTTNINEILSGMKELNFPDLPTTLTSFSSSHAIDNCDSFLTISLRDNFQLKTSQFSKVKNLKSLSFMLQSSSINNNIDIGLTGIASNSDICAKIQKSSISLTTIFQNCKAQSITFTRTSPSYSFSSIASEAFSGCFYLKSLDLSFFSIDTLSENLFKDCRLLNSLTLPNTILYIKANSFNGANSNALTSLPVNLREIDNVGFDLNIQSIPSTIQKIGANAFSNSSVVTNENINLTNLTTIGDGAFSNSNVKSIINYKLTTVPKECFSGCGTLESFDFSRVTTIKESAFAATGLTSTSSTLLEFPSVTKIETLSFSGIVNDLFVKLPTALMTSTNFTTDVFKESSLRKVQIDMTNADFDTNLRSLAGGSLKPASYAFSDVYPVYQRVKTMFGSSTDFTLVLDDITISEKGVQTSYRCLVYADAENTNLTSCNTAESDYSIFINNPTLPDTTLKIGSNVFLNNSDLTAIDLEYTQEIGNQAFSATPISKISSDYVTTVKTKAFYGDTSLTSVYLKKATSIESQTFQGCTYLRETNFNSLTTITDNLFSGCTRIQDISLPEALTASTGSFKGCTSLTSVSLPKIQEIDANSFQNCTSLRQITFPNTLVNGQASVFTGSTNLKSITFNGSILYFSSIGILNGCSRDLSVFLPNSTLTDIYSGLRTNGIQATTGTTFYTYDKDMRYPSLIVTSSSSIIQVPNGLIVDPGTLNIIGSQDIYIGMNTSIESSQIEGFNKICTGAFYSSSLKSLEIPSSWRTTILASGWSSKFESTPFSGPTFKFITVSDNYNSSVDSGIWTYLFSRCKTDGGAPVIYFNNGYLTETNFMDSSNPFILDGSTIVGVNDNNATSEQFIPASVTRIKEKALSKTKKITSLKLSNGRASTLTVDNNILYGNQTVTAFDFMGVTQVCLSPSSFYKSYIQEIKLSPISLSVNGYGLNKTSTLKSIEYDSGIQHINLSAMIDCWSQLTSIVLPDTLKSIGDYAFAEVYDPFPRLCSLTFTDCPGLSSIGDYAFFNSIRKTSNNRLAFPSGVERIGKAAFAYKSRNLKMHTISSLDVHNVKDIQTSAFQYNTLREVIFESTPSRLTSIGDYAFDRSQYKYSIFIPSSVSSIGYNAFRSNVILNPENVKANIISVDHTITDTLSIIGISGGIGREISEKYQASNFLGLTPNTVISAVSDWAGKNYYKDFIYVTVDERNLASRMLNVCPSKVNIDIYQKQIHSVDSDAVSAFIPTYITGYYEGAFQNCSDLEYLSDFYNDNEYILFENPPDYLFNGCWSLKNVKLLSTSTSVGRSAFQDCRSLTSIWPDIDHEEFRYYKLQSIGDHAFAGCNRLLEFSIPRSIQYIIGSDTFCECDSLTAINIDLTDEEFKERVKSKSTQTVGEVIRDKFQSIRTDYRCKINFTNAIYTNDGKVKIDHEFIRLRDTGTGLSAISGLSFSSPDVREQSYLNISAVSEVDPYVFDGLDNLESINFLSSRIASLTSIGNYSFYNCTSLFTISNNKLAAIQNIGDYAFGNCPYLVNMEINLDTLENAGRGVFYNTNLNTLTFYTSRGVAEYNSVLSEIKEKIGYSNDRNPLEVPEGCSIKIRFSDGSAQLNYMLDDITQIVVGINRQNLIFTDRTTSSIKPLLLVESQTLSAIPAIVANTFHANIIGRWK